MIYTRHQSGSKRRFAWIYSSTRWKALRSKVFRERGEQCEVCFSIGEVQLHHRVPVSLGGEIWNPDNLEIVCRSCHLEKHRKIEETKMPLWKRKLYDLIDKPVAPRLIRLKTNMPRRANQNDEYPKATTPAV